MSQRRVAVICGYGDRDDNDELVRVLFEWILTIILFDAVNLTRNSNGVWLLSRSEQHTKK